MLQPLGDELIGSPRLAVFELAKNAYDADATEVVVRLDLASGGEPTITVTGDGGRHVTRSASAGLAGTR